SEVGRVVAVDGLARRLLGRATEEVGVFGEYGKVGTAIGRPFQQLPGRLEVRRAIVAGVELAHRDSHESSLGCGEPESQRRGPRYAVTSTSAVTATPRPASCTGLTFSLSTKSANSA